MSNIILPLDIESLKITSQSIDNKGNIILDVVSSDYHSTCHKCGQKATRRNGYSKVIEVEHTKILERKVYLRIKPVRYKCDHCDVQLQSNITGVKEMPKLLKLWKSILCAV